MIKDIKNRKPPKYVEIDLRGPEGNAFVLLAYAKRFAKLLELDEKKIIKEMTSSDYENLIRTFDKYFGDFVILYR